MLKITLAVIIITMISVFIRLIKGQTIWSKLLALNLFAVLTTMLIATYAVYINVPLVIDIAITYSIVGFLALTLLTRYIEAGGKK